MKACDLVGHCIHPLPMGRLGTAITAEEIFLIEHGTAYLAAKHETGHEIDVPFMLLPAKEGIP